MYKLAPSEKQWIISFLLVDALFWIFVAQDCFSDAVGCFESSNFGIFFYYAPFWLIASAIPDISSINYPLSTIIGAITGILGHILLGFGTGHFLRREPVQWKVSVPISFAIVLIVIVAFYGIALTTGILQ